MKRVRDIAFARAGDKGDTSSVAVTCFDQASYVPLAESLTVERVRVAYEGIAQGTVTRHEIPGHATLIFVMEQALGGGVSRSLCYDPHGKSLSSIMLALEV
jgi:hypothetical protein